MIQLAQAEPIPGRVVHKFKVQGSLLSATWPFRYRLMFAWRLLIGKPIYFTPLDFEVRDTEGTAGPTQAPAEA